MQRVLTLSLIFAARLTAFQSFDVASVKPSPVEPGDTININLGTIRGGELSLSNATLTDCVKFAYGLVSDEQVAGPDWTKSREVRFHILAKAPASTPREQMLLMLRELLAERFHLATHTEQRAFSHYALVIGRNGAKLHNVTAEPGGPRATYRPGLIVHNQISMHTLALLLSRQLRALVLDRTGLSGVYDLKLEFTPEPSQPGIEPSAGAAPGIFAAIQEQLGLKLEGRKDGVEILVIDRADRVPVAN